MINTDRPLLYGNIKETTLKVYVEEDESLADESEIHRLVPEITTVTRYLFDGRIESIDNYGLDEHENTGCFCYDIKGKLTEVIEKKPSGDSYKSSMYLYSKNGLVDEFIVFSGPGEMDFRFNYSYNSESLLVAETISYQGNRYDAMTTRYDYFPESGKRILLHSDPEGNFTGKEIESYDKAGDLICLLAYERNGLLRAKTRYEHDKHGNILIREIVHYDDCKSVFIHKYIYWYDSQNNWVKNHNYTNGAFKSFAIRDIVYNPVTS